MIDPGADVAQPLQPASLVTSGAAWPRPRLGKRATVLGLTYSQAFYAVAVFEVWDVARSLVGGAGWRLPWPSGAGLLAWTIACVVVAVPLLFVRWHGLDALAIVERWQRDAVTPRLYVWRPVPPKWEEQAVEAAEEERDVTRRHLHTYRAPLATPGNPLGWELDRPTLARTGSSTP